MTATILFPEPDSPDGEQPPRRHHLGPADNWHSRFLELQADTEPLFPIGDRGTHEADQPATPRTTYFLWVKESCADAEAVLRRWCQDRAGQDDRDGELVPVRRRGEHDLTRWADTLSTLRTRLDRVQAFRVVPASTATLLAGEVQTQQEMGQALTLLREKAGLTIDQLTNKVAPQRIAGTCRSTIARVFKGGTLCATPEALAALVKACGVDDTDVNVWVAAWDRARSRQNPRGRRSISTPAPVNTPLTDSGATDDKATDRITAVDLDVDSTAGTASTDQPVDDHSPVTTPGSRTSLAIVDDLTGPDNHVDEDDILADTGNHTGNDDEVIGTVQITRGHLRAAVVITAVAGLAATSSPAPAVRNAGAAVLGVAGVIALVEVLRAHDATADPRGVPKAA